ncbi:glycosyltransferase family 4 protein, partial [Dietzia timorensis]
MARYLLLCWRDSSHPQGGGSERYLEHIGRYLAASGHEVVFRTAKYRGAARTESAGGVTFRRGGRRLSVYPRACLFLLRERAAARMGRREAFSAVIDTQNGVPFFAATFSGAPTVVLTHHCHREQWPVAGPVLARIGWWIESRLSPRVHRRRQWLTVSRPSAAELASLGVPASRIAVIRNGVDPIPAGISAGTPSGRAPGPRLVVLSRLVPHKHVEDALSLLAELLPDLPDLHLDVIGGGWWEPQLREHADALGVSGATTFHGHVSEHRKHEILRAATVHLMPSRKEGWG